MAEGTPARAKPQAKSILELAAELASPHGTEPVSYDAYAIDTLRRELARLAERDRLDQAIADLAPLITLLETSRASPKAAATLRRLADEAVHTKQALLASRDLQAVMRELAIARFFSGAPARPGAALYVAQEDDVFDR